MHHCLIYGQTLNSTETHETPLCENPSCYIICLLSVLWNTWSKAGQLNNDLPLINRIISHLVFGQLITEIAFFSNPSPNFVHVYSFLFVHARMQTHTGHTHMQQRQIHTTADLFNAVQAQSVGCFIDASDKSSFRPSHVAQITPLNQYSLQGWQWILGVNPKYGSIAKARKWITCIYNGKWGTSCMNNSNTLRCGRWHYSSS